MKKKSVIVVIILVLSIIFGIIYVKAKQELKMQESIDGKTEKGQLLLSNIGVFSEKYSGEYKTSEIMKKLQETTKENIPKLYKDVEKLSEEKIEEYYNNNKTNIKDNFGKNNYEEFKILVDELKKVEASLTNWDKLDVDAESFKEVSNKYSYVEYVVTYDRDTEVRYAIYIAKKNITKPSFIIDIVE